MSEMAYPPAQARQPHFCLYSVFLRINILVNVHSNLRYLIGFFHYSLLLLYIYIVYIYAIS